MKIKMLRTFSLILLFIFNSLFFAQSETHKDKRLYSSDSLFYINDTTDEVSLSKFTQDQIEHAPIRETKDLLKLFPGLTTYQNRFHLRGSRSDEIAYTINGAPITDLFNGEQLLYIPLNIIDEVELFSGSQPISIGNSGSGIIQYKLKSDGDKLEFDIEQISDNMGFNGKSNAYSGNERLGTYWYGYSETNLNIGGPIPNSPIRFFINGNYKIMRDKNPQRYPGIDNLLLSNSEYYNDPFYHDSLLINYPAGIVYGNSIEKYNIYGSLDFDFDHLQINLMGIYDNQLQDVSRNHIQSFLNSRIGKNEQENIFLSLSASHKLSSILSYNIQASYTSNHEETYDPYLKDDFWAYGDSVANAKVGIFWERSDIEKYAWQGLTSEDTRYISPATRNFYGFRFQQNGKSTVNYSKSSQEQFSVAGNLDIRVFQHNTMKIGGSYRQGILRKWETQMLNHSSFAWILAHSLKRDNHGTEREEKAKILISNGVNNYGYNIFGNLSDDGFDAPHSPSFIKLFIEDSFLYKDFFLKLGLVYDYIDIENFILSDPTKPENSFDNVLTYSNNGLINYNKSGFKDSPSYSYFSPRLNTSYKVNKNFLIKAQYGHFIKQSKLEDSYNSLSSLWYLFVHTGFFSKPIGTYLEPTIIEKIDLEFIYNLTPNYSFKINSYIYNFLNQKVVVIEETSPMSPLASYPTYSNTGYSDITGIDFSLNLKPITGLQIISYISYLQSNAKIDSRNETSPLVFTKPLSANFLVNYFFGKPSYLTSFFRNLKFSSIISYSSGHPFTSFNGGTSIETDPRFRTATNSINSQTTTSNFQVNLRIDKTVEIYNKVNLNFYIYAINIFNNENILDVFLRTGSAKTDGFLEDPNMGGKLIEVYGENFVELYKLINSEYLPRSAQMNMYGEPRQIIMGIKLNL